MLSAGREAPSLGTGPAVPGEVLDALQTAQDDVDRLVPEVAPTPGPTADPGPALTAAERTPLRQLVVAIGLVRLRADGNSYSADLGDQLVRAYDDAVTACTS